MSKKDSNKELKGIYRRCLSSLNQVFKAQEPNGDQCRSLAEKAAKEASRMTFASVDARGQWIKRRVEELYNDKLAKAYADPNGELKEQIKAKISRLG